MFNSRVLDAFDRWVAAQRDTQPGGARLVTVPPARTCGRTAATLDRYGAWRLRAAVRLCLVSDGGYRAGRPYYNGYWATVPAYGWTWIGCERWAGRRITTDAGDIARSPVVLDSGTSLGTGMGLVGVRRQVT